TARLLFLTRGEPDGSATRPGAFEPGRDRRRRCGGAQQTKAQRRAREGKPEPRYPTGCEGLARIGVRHRVISWRRTKQIRFGVARVCYGGPANSYLLHTPPEYRAPRLVPRGHRRNGDSRPGAQGGKGARQVPEKRRSRFLASGVVRCACVRRRISRAGRRLPLANNGAPYYFGQI